MKFTARSEVKLEAARERPFARQLGIKIQRIEPVILIREIEHAQAHFRRAMTEAPAGENVELPEIIARLLRRVILIGLRGPDGFGLREKPVRMIVERVELHLMEDGFEMAHRSGRDAGGNFC